MARNGALISRRMTFTRILEHTIAAQVVLSLILGAAGLLFATPLTAAVLVVVQATREE